MHIYIYIYIYIYMYGKLFQHLVRAVGDKKKPHVLTAGVFMNSEVPGYSVSFLPLSEG